ncbi:MAG: holo-ACP synthase [Treponema sp.]
MILGIGVDIIKTSRFIKWEKNTKLAMRFFAKEELDYIQSKGNLAHLSFASHFAAKEAYGKAIGLGLSGMKLKDISVCFINGVPTLKLENKAEKYFKNKGGKCLHLSLSHEKENAVAMVIIEG